MAGRLWDVLGTVSGRRGAHPAGEVAKPLVPGTRTDLHRRRARTACVPGKPQGTWCNGSPGAVGSMSI